MTIRILIFIDILFLLAFTSKTKIDYTVIPGQGLDSIKIGISTRQDIEQYLGKGRLERRTFYYDCIRPNGKKKHTDPFLCYDSLGVEFEFLEANIKKPISWIKFTNKTDWIIQGGFRINHTTRKEVYDKFKFPTNGQNEVGYIDYDSLGIGFYFKYYNEQYNHKYLQTDTLISVIIYARTK